MGADPIATLTPWAAAGGAVAGVVAAGATMYLGLQTRRLGDLTRATTVHEQEQLELLRRDRDMRLRPVVEFHGYTVVAGSGPQRKAAILTVSNHGHGLAVNAFCVGRLMDERDGERLAVDPIHERAPSPLSAIGQTGSGSLLVMPAPMTRTLVSGRGQDELSPTLRRNRPEPGL